jgi:hypothetical protein
MNTLWIFGDRFSTEINSNNLHENHKKFMELKDVSSIPSWTSLLSEKLKLVNNNLSKESDSNYQIFQNFCDVCHLIQPNDVVIIGWGLISKFRVSLNNQFVNLDPYGLKDIGTVSKKTLEEILKNRLKNEKEINRRDRWAEEVYLWENVISELSKNKNFNVFFWSTEELRLIYCESEDFKSKKNYLCSDSVDMLISYLRERGCTTMSDETNGEVSDSHFGIEGNKKIAEIFYDDITKKLVKQN